MPKRKRLSSSEPFDPNSWRSPRKVIALLLVVFVIVGDAAAADDNHIVPRYITKEQNALGMNWMVYFEPKAEEWIFCNPPYGKTKDGKSGLKKWTHKCRVQAEEYGVNVLLLVPEPQGQVDLWGVDVYGKACMILHFNGRLAYEHPLTGEPYNHTNFGSYLIVYNAAKIRSSVPFDTIITSDVSKLKSIAQG